MKGSIATVVAGSRRVCRRQEPFTFCIVVVGVVGEHAVARGGGAKRQPAVKVVQARRWGNQVTCVCKVLARPWGFGRAVCAEQRGVGHVELVGWVFVFGWGKPLN